MLESLQYYFLKGQHLLPGKKQGKEKISLYQDMGRFLGNHQFLMTQEDFVPIINQHLNSSLLDGGKRLRPILCFLMGKLFHLELEKIFPYALVAEMTHAATLAHDDVIDESSKRRNKPTLNTKTSNQYAVFAGDYLLSEALKRLCLLGENTLTLELTNTLKALVQGEWLQLGARGKVAVCFKDLELVATLKTASVMRWCCMVAPVLAKESVELIELCQKFGEHLGIGFQMVDDILDFKKSSEKTMGLDLREGLINFVALAVMHLEPDYKNRFQKLFQTKEFDSFVIEPEILAKAQQNILSQAEAQIQLAKETLNQIKEKLSLPSEYPAFQELNRLIDKFVKRSK